VTHDCRSISSPRRQINPNAMFGHRLTNSSTSAHHMNSSHYPRSLAPTGFGSGAAGVVSADLFFPEPCTSDLGIADSLSTPWSRWSAEMSSRHHGSEERGGDHGHGLHTMNNWVTSLTAHTGRQNGGKSKY